MDSYEMCCYRNMKYLAIGIFFFQFIFPYTNTLANLQSSKINKAKAQLILFEKNIAEFKNDIKRYPTNEEGLSILRMNPSNINNWNGPYIKKEIPPDPWGNKYVYFFPAKYGNKDYDIYSFGKNMKDNRGLEDDITNWKKINYDYYDKYFQLRRVFIFFILISTIALLFLFLIRRRLKKIHS